MKTSFYFVIWMIIYPFLGLFHNQVLSQNSFIAALIMVWGLSWLLNRAMPDTLRYEAALSKVKVLEQLYTGNIQSIHRSISRQITIQFITAIYFGVTFVFVLYSILRHSDANDWIALVLFGLFAYGAVNGASTLSKAKWRLINDPSPETASEVLKAVYRLDYKSYYIARRTSTPEAMLPPAPPHIKAFRIFSFIVAVICTILGLIQLLKGGLFIAFNLHDMGISGGIMYLLYGSLAAYFGLKDTVDIGSDLRNPIWTK